MLLFSMQPLSLDMLPWEQLCHSNTQIRNATNTNCAVTHALIPALSLHCAREITDIERPCVIQDLKGGKEGKILFTYKRI